MCHWLGKEDLLFIKCIGFISFFFVLVSRLSRPILRSFVRLRSKPRLRLAQDERGLLCLETKDLFVQIDLHCAHPELIVLRSFDRLRSEPSTRDSLSKDLMLSSSKHQDERGGAQRRFCRPINYFIPALSAETHLPSSSCCTSAINRLEYQ